MLFLVKVAAGRQDAVFRLAMALERVHHGTATGGNELLFLASLGPDGAGAAARWLAELDGVESVQCSSAQPLSA